MNSNSILQIARIYAVAVNRKPSTVSLRAFGSGDIIKRLEDGRGITLQRAGRAMQWFSDNWPDNAIWPSDIHRPTPSRIPDKDRGAA